MKEEKLDTILDHLYGELEPEAEEDFLNEALSSKALGNRLNETRKVLTAYRLAPVMEIPSNSASNTLLELHTLKKENEEKAKIQSTNDNISLNNVNQSDIIKTDNIDSNGEDKTENKKTTNENNYSESIEKTAITQNFKKKQHLSLVTIAAIIIIGIGIGIIIFNNSTSTLHKNTINNDKFELSLKPDSTTALTKQPEKQKQSIIALPKKQESDLNQNTPKISSELISSEAKKEKVNDILEEIDEISLTTPENEITVIDKSDKLQLTDNDSDILDISSIDIEENNSLEFTQIDEEIEKIAPELNENSTNKSDNNYPDKKDSDIIEKFLSEINTSNPTLTEKDTIKIEDSDKKKNELNTNVTTKSLPKDHAITKQQADQKKLFELKRKKEQERLAEVERKKEQNKLAENERKKEQERLAEIERKKEQERLAEIERKKEQERLAEIERKKEQERFAEIERKKEQERLAEIERKKEQERLAEIERKKEQEKLAEIERKKEQERLAEIERKKEQEKLAEIERKKEQERLAEIERKKEQERLAEIERKKEQERLAEIERKKEQERLAEIELTKEQDKLAKIEREKQNVKIVEPILLKEGHELYSVDNAPSMALKEKDNNPIAQKINTAKKHEKIEFEITDTANDLIQKSEALYIQKSFLQALFGTEEALSRSENTKDTIAALILKARIELKLKSFSDMKNTINKLQPLSPLEASALQILYTAGINHLKVENKRETLAAQAESTNENNSKNSEVLYINEKTNKNSKKNTPQKNQRKHFNPTTDTYYKRK